MDSGERSSTGSGKVGSYPHHIRNLLLFNPGTDPRNIIAGAKSYKSPPLTNFQLRLRDYDLGGRVMLQYCHIPTESTYQKMLTEVDDKNRTRRILPGTFPCVTTGALGAHPTQQRSFSPRERLRAQGFPDYLSLRFGGELKKEDLYKESDFASIQSLNHHVLINMSGRD